MRAVLDHRNINLRKKRIPACVVSMTGRNPELLVWWGKSRVVWCPPEFRTLTALCSLGVSYSLRALTPCGRTLTHLPLRKMPMARSSFSMTTTRGWPARRPPPCVSGGLRTSSCFPEVSGAVFPLGTKRQIPGFTILQPSLITFFLWVVIISYRHSLGDTAGWFQTTAIMPVSQSSKS